MVFKLVVYISTFQLYIYFFNQYKNYAQFTAQLNSEIMKPASTTKLSPSLSSFSVQGHEFKSLMQIISYSFLKLLLLSRTSSSRWFCYYYINQSISSSSLYLTISFTAFTHSSIRKWVIFIFSFSVARHSQTQCSEKVHRLFLPFGLVKHCPHLLKVFREPSLNLKLCT